jgi:hypothetical protein
MTSELTARLHGTHLKSYTGDLTLDFAPDGGKSSRLADPAKPSRVSQKDLGPRERVTLRIQKGKVSLREGKPAKNSIRAGDEMAMLLLGSEPIDDIASRTGLKCLGPEARELGRVLFPPQNPMLGAMDRY